MANVPAKMIETKLKKEGIKIDGYDVINHIEMDYLEEAKRLGMDDGITAEYEFLSEYQVKEVKITFYGNIIEDYRQVGPDQEIPYYYPHLNSCRIEKDGEKEIFIEMDMYWN